MKQNIWIGLQLEKDVFCGEEGRYYEPYDKNKPLELPDDYDFETYIQLL